MQNEWLGQPRRIVRWQEQRGCPPTSTFWRMNQHPDFWRLERGSWWRPYCRFGLAAGAAGRPGMCWRSVVHHDMAPQRRICCCPPLGTNAGVNDRSFEGARRARSRPLPAKNRSRAVSAPMPSRKPTHPPARSWRFLTPNALSAKRWPPATPGETCSRVREKKSRFSGPYYPLVTRRSTHAWRD